MAVKGIIGTKLGMTQIFDQESGKVTSVTVVEAGPCPVVQVKTPETDGYTAVQLAFGAVKEKRISRPEAGHLKKAGQGPHRHLVEIRDAEGLAVGDSVTVEAFEPGERIKVSGRSKGKGFAGTISATTSAAARSATARTTCASRGRSAHRRRRRASSRACGCRVTWGTSASPSAACAWPTWMPSATCC